MTPARKNWLLTAAAVAILAVGVVVAEPMWLKVALVAFLAAYLYVAVPRGVSMTRDEHADLALEAHFADHEDGGAS